MHLFSGDTLIQNNHIQKKTDTAFSADKKRVLIIHNEELTDELSLMIENMMKACKLSIDDYEILNLSENNTPWKIISSLAIYFQEVILFGNLEPILKLQLTFNLNQPSLFDQKAWIKTHTIREIHEEKDKKMNFWSQALQPYFT